MIDLRPTCYRFVFAIAALWMIPASAQTVTFEAGATDFRVASISDLMIGANTYDVTFTHGGSYDDLETASLPNSPITFTSEASANTAMAAIDAAINATATNASGGTADSRHLIPYQVTASTVSLARDIQSGLNPLTFVADTSQSISTSTSLSSTFGFATFAQQAAAVPEPGTIGLAAVIAVGGYLRVRRKRRKLVSSL